MAIALSSFAGPELCSTREITSHGSQPPVVVWRHLWRYSGAYRLAPSPRGSAALLRRSVSVGFPQYPTHLLAVLSVRRAARCALTGVTGGVPAVAKGENRGLGPQT